MSTPPYDAPSNQPLALHGRRVTLRPMQPEDRAPLLAAAADGELWRLPVTVVPGEATIDDYMDKAWAGQAAGTMLPFVTVVDGTVVGSTRFWKLDRQNRKTEIGHTWIAASWQRSVVNTEAKFLMLRHAFEELGLIRVQFTTDVLNERSRAAILRLGAVQEGIVRYERIMPDGRRRDSVRFSIIEPEWPAVRGRLLERLGRAA